MADRVYLGQATMPVVIDESLDSSSTNPVQNKVVTQALAGKEATISDLETIRSGAALGATAVQPSQVDQTYSATSTNAQSGVAVANAVSTKADTNLSNVNNTGKSTSAGWAMPSSTASAVSLSTSSTNTMTSAGWVIVGAYSNNIGSVNLQIGSTIHKVCSSYTGGNAQSFNYYPVYAGETVNISTDGTGTIDLYVFVPCAGVN